MSTKSQSFQTLDDPTRIAFRVELPDGTAPAFATTGQTDVEVDERYWNSYDGELYRVTSVDDNAVEAVLEFGCGEIPRVVSFDREWFTPDSHGLHHVTPQTD
ncbi:hypothetical protein ACERIT_07450 [Halopenitus sp. H-Gu1]|uniref:hypothetical protein n=1 Tax=Halopenitus sp. H-Gu1 TaxID=3242697 RepID=UPI00359D1A72